MYINSIGFHIPSKRITNEYFERINGLTPEWILQRTGISTRSRVALGEDMEQIGIASVSEAIKDLTYDVQDVDLIISASYTVTDTIGTLAHRVQRRFNMPKAQAFAVSSACSSLVNAVEIAQGYFAMNKASKALIVCSEANSIYSDDTNDKSGHLWGDAAVSFFLSKERQSQNEPEIVDVLTHGLGFISKGPEGVCLYPHKGGITMHDGRDVFHYACTYMARAMEELLERNQMKIDDVNYFACHQANFRIVKNIANQWKLPEERFFNNIQELGNTGSASAMLALAQNVHKVKKGEKVGVAVFGGGYSSGSMLIQF
ncbi:MAG: 3-oxoacyl-ACP synthase III family protein [Bacteroidales bacterium]